MREYEVFVFGEDREPARVFVALDLGNYLHVEVYKDDE